MLTSALISQCRREFFDIPKSTRMARTGDGSINLFNVARFPVVENSYSVYKGTSAQTETTNFTLDLDSGDLQFVVTPANTYETRMDFKYANWRDKNWAEVINDGIQALNGRGFFKQQIRLARYLSAGVRSFSAPSACIDLYELLYSPSSGQFTKLGTNWSYQQDGNKVVLGSPPTQKLSGAISYLRNLQTYTATSATLDVKDEWIPLVKKYAGHRFFGYMAGKIATQGKASVEEGHFSFTNARTRSRDLLEEFNIEALRAKPTRPAKDITNVIPGGGFA